jgi:uncharacterized protein YpmB
LYLAVRTTLEPASVTSAIRQQVLAIDKDMPIYEVSTMDSFCRNPSFSLVSI